MTDGAPIEALYLQLIDSWNTNHATSFGALFTEDGSLVGFDGSSVETHTAITEHLGAIFADHHPATYVAKVREVRQVGPGVAPLRSVAGMVPPGGDDIKPDVNAIQAVVAVDHDGEWRVAHFHTTPAAFHGRPEEADALTTELRAALRQSSVQ